MGDCKDFPIFKQPFLIDMFKIAHVVLFGDVLCRRGEVSYIVGEMLYKLGEAFDRAE